MNTMIEISLMILAVIIHELGHILGYWLFGYKTKLRFSGLLLRVELINKTDELDLTIWSEILIVFLGILFGLPFVLFTKDLWCIFIYLLACSVDFGSLFGLLEIKNKKQKMYQLVNLRYEELGKDLKEYKKRKK